MLTLWLPAVLALPWALSAWRRRLRRGDPRYLLPLVWWLLLVLFFSIPSGKRDVYILPALPMFCLALAQLLPGLLRRRGFRWLLLGFTAALVLLLGAAGSVLLGQESGRLQALIARRALADGTVQMLGWTLLAIGLWGGGGLVLAALLALIWIVQRLLVNPLLSDSSSGRGLMREVGRRLGPDAELGLVDWKEQNLLMADRPMLSFGFKRPWEQQLQAAVAWQALQPQRRWLLVQEKALLDPD